MSQLGQHLFEPGAVTTGFESDDYFTSECAIKPPHVVTLMAQLKPMDLAICQVTVTDGLLTSMKINCDIYCHRAPPLLITNPTVSVNNSRSEVPVSSHQISCATSATSARCTYRTIRGSRSSPLAASLVRLDHAAGAATRACASVRLAP